METTGIIGLYRDYIGITGCIHRGYIGGAGGENEQHQKQQQVVQVTLWVMAYHPGLLDPKIPY